MMASVIERRVSPLRALARRVSRAGAVPTAVVLSTLLVTACGSASGRDASASPTTTITARPVTSTLPSTLPSTPPSTPPPSAEPTRRVAAPTPVPPSSVPAPTLPAIGSTTLFPTSTVAAQETEPIAPPLDAHASEPVIEMGTISIPKIGVATTLYEGIRLTTLDYGPGHWPGSALPGRPGNLVVAGHRSSKHQVFREVDQLASGDEIVFEDAAGRHVYRVDRVEIVDPTAMWIVDPTETPTATLFACHPPGSTRQRIVVFADLVTG
jgi:sortase A